MNNKLSLIDVAKEVIDIEIEALIHIKSRINISFDEAVEAISDSEGRTIVCGMGKSGIIGKKIAASLASTGSPSFFIHPGEAFHGDLGMIKPQDTFIAISNSGETDELLKLLPFLKSNGNFIVAMSGNVNSTLVKNSNTFLDISVQKEACPYQLAPTSSTTATLAMGDALTVALMIKNEFKPESFARFHPGGALGRRLLSKVCDEMVSSKIPLVPAGASFVDIISELSAGGLGMTLVQLDDNKVAIITDGDLRRAMEECDKAAFDLTAEEFATIEPCTISPDVHIQQAYEVMEEKNVTSLVVVEDGRVVGIFKK